VLARKKPGTLATVSQKGAKYFTKWCSDIFRSGRIFNDNVIVYTAESKF